MAFPSGAVVARMGNTGIPNSDLILHVSGTYTAADFTVDASDGVAFTPASARVVNMSTADQMEAWNGVTNGLKTVTAGTQTTEASGIAFGDRQLTLTVATVGIANNNEFLLILGR